MSNLCIVSTSPACQARAEEIAEYLGLPDQNLNGERDHAHSDFQLLVDVDGLSVKKTDSNRKPLRVDFNTGPMTYRRVNSSRRNEAIARAVGIGRIKTPVVVDATAGLGTDSFILATLGCSVIMLEKSPLMSLLLQDGLRRAAQVDALAEIITRMTLKNVEARDWIKHQQNLRGHIIYLDPMFPAKTGSALSRGEMQMMQEIIDPGEKIDNLLSCARASGADRVVLKRPLREKGEKPTYCLKGKASRFDVFVRPQKSEVD